MRASILLLAFAGSLALAADATTLTDLPNLSTATEKTSASSATATSASSATGSSASSGTSASSATSGSSGSATTTDASSTTGASSSAASTTNSVSHLTGLPTIAGAAIPTMVIPYTAAAPFMQKSTLPEGTVFICIGAILGFLGLCVLAWRAMIAYTINKSVKRAALASIMASDAKAPAWLAGGTPMKKGPGGKMYKQPSDSDALSLEALTVHGKKADPYASRRHSAVPTRKEQARDPSSLFFSPTAAGIGGANPPPMAGLSGNNRSSQYLPAGYYAAPSAQAAGGAATTTIGGGLTSPSYSRVTPPESPNVRPQSSYLRPGRDESRNRASWAANTPNRNSAPMLSPTYNPGHGSQALYSQPSTSSLAVGFGAGEENLPGSRAPSAYFDDVLEHHGNGPRERY